MVDVKAVKGAVGVLSFLMLFLVVGGMMLLAGGEKKGEKPVKPRPCRVLFIGNSFTYGNDLPGMFVKLANAAGKRVIVDQSTFGGASLEFHAQNAHTRDKIYQDRWDYVVLQTGDIVAFQDLHHVLGDRIKSLQQKIYDNRKATKVMYFMLWGWRDGRHMEREDIYYTYEEYQKMIYDGTIAIARQLGLVIAPVGWAWQAAIKQKPRIKFKLFAFDNYHPALRGSYLGACVFYAAVFRESAEGLPYTGGLSAKEARFFQKVASATVLDNLALWNLGPRKKAKK